MAYAQHTRVSVQQSQADIQSVLARYGADKFGLTVEPGRAVILFQAHGRTVRFVLPMPEGVSEKDQQERRRRWRALLLTIKAKLESIASKIETFDEAFLAHVVTESGETVYEKAKPMLALAPPSSSNVQPLSQLKKR